MNEFEWRRQLRDLRKPVVPPGDLWAQIEARLDDTATSSPPVRAAQSPRRPMFGRGWLAAASLAALFLLGGSFFIRLHQQQAVAPAGGAATLAAAWKPSDPRLTGAAIELSSAQMELRQALQQAPDSPALQRLLSRTDQQQSQLRHLEHQAS